MATNDIDAEIKKIAEELDKAMRGTAGGFNSLSAVLRKGTTTADEFTKGFSDALNIVPAIGSVLSAFGKNVAVATEYIEETNNMYNQLAKNGAGLSGSLFELRASFNESRMSLDQFTRFAADNSQELAAFAGGVSAGTKMIGQYGKALNTATGDAAPLINQFLALGYTIDEATEFTARYSAQNQRSNRIAQRDALAQANQAAEYAKQLKVISALTGKNAQKMAEEINERKRDGATRAALMLAEQRAGEKGAEVAASYDATQAALQKSPKVMRDLLDDLIQTGVPMSEATQNFAALNGEAYNLLVKAAQATKAGDVEEAQRLTEEAAAKGAEFAQSEMGLTIATYSQASDIAKGQADALAEMGPIIDQVRGNMEDLEATTGQSNTFLDAWNQAVENSKNKVNDTVSGLVAGTNVKQIYDAVGKEITDATVQVQNKVTDTLANADAGAEDFAINAASTIGGAGEKITNGIITKLEGMPIFEDDMKSALESLDENQKQQLGISNEMIEKYNEYMSLGAEDTGKKADLRAELGGKIFESQYASEEDQAVFKELGNIAQQIKADREKTNKENRQDIIGNGDSEPYGEINAGLEELYNSIDETFKDGIDIDSINDTNWTKFLNSLGQRTESEEAEKPKDKEQAVPMSMKTPVGPVRETPDFSIFEDFAKEDQARKAEQDSIQQQVASLGPEMKSVFDDLLMGRVPENDDVQKIFEENGAEAFAKVQDLATQMQGTYSKDYSQVAMVQPQAEVPSMTKDPAEAFDKVQDLATQMQGNYSKDSQVAMVQPQAEVPSMPKDPTVDPYINNNNIADNMQSQSNTLQKSIDDLSMMVGKLIGQLEGPTTLANAQPEENNMEKQLVSLNDNVKTLIGINTQTMNLYKRNLEEVRSNATFA